MVEEATEEELNQLSDKDRKQLEPTGKLTANVMRSIRLLSRMGTALYVSDLGEPLMRNFEREKNARNIDAMEAAGDSFLSMIDNLLVAYGAAQVHFAKEHVNERPIIGTFSAVRLGNNIFIFCVAATNIALFINTVVEARRTRFWHALPGFDHSKVQDVVLSVDSGWRKQLHDDASHINNTDGQLQVKLSHSKGESVMSVFYADEAEGNVPISKNSELSGLRRKTEEAGGDSVWRNNTI